MDPRVIVVGTDFSDDATQALVYAVRLAEAMDAELRVVHAWNPTGWPSQTLVGDQSADPILEAARGGAEEMLRATTEEHTSGRAEAVSIFASEPASRVLPRIAEEERATLLVVGKSGAARLPHVPLGSVSDRVVRSAVCPVLVVPRRQEPFGLPDRMLVGIDFSNASREAFCASLRLGSALECRRSPLLVHAYQDERALWLASWSETSMTRRINHDPDELRRWAMKQDSRAGSCEFEHVEGVAEEALTRVARLANCDWIVLGVQGRTALASFLIGSTTQRILEAAARPVLVVPPREAPERESVG